MPRILVIDDSATMRRILQTCLEGPPDNEVFVARSGAEALAMIPQIAPDVLTLDIVMDGMDGIETLERVMATRPLPVVMISSLTSNGAAVTMTALSMGAVDFIQKPQGALSPDLEPFRSQLLFKVRTAARATVRAPLPRPPSAAPTRPAPRAVAGAVPAKPSAALPGVAAAPSRPVRTGYPLVLIGASTGGPPVIETILSHLPPGNAAPVVIAQHMPDGFTGAFAARLDRNLAVPVREVTEWLALQPGHVYVGRGGGDVLIARREDRLFACPMPSDPAYPWHPSVNRLVESALKLVDPRRIVAVLATGMGDDGASAMAEVHRRGGLTMAESRDTSVVWGMPRALAETGAVDRIEPSHRMGPALVEMIGGQAQRRAV